MAEEKKGAFKKLIEEYKSSLKPPETEELVNSIINRPLAFLVAKIFYRLKRSPNFVTLFSLVFGVASGFFFMRGSYASNLTGAVLLELMVIFDCADGQLARMTGKSSKFGKTLDGLADMMTHFSIFYGLAAGIYLSKGTILPFISAVIAQLSMYLHVIMYDHFKNVFIHVTRPDYVDKLETPEQLEEKIKRDEQKYGKNSIKAFISKLYYLFYKIEYWAVSIAYPRGVKSFYDVYPDPSKLDTEFRDMYYKEMKLSVRLWSFIGDTMHLSIFIIFALLNSTHLIFPVIIFATNAYMIAVTLYQRKKFMALKIFH